MPLRQRVIHAFAYQSFLWNRALSTMLRSGVLSAQRLRVSTIAGDLLAWKYLAPEREEKLRTMRTPLFGIDGDGGSEPFRRAMIEELREAGLQRRNFVDNEVPGMIWKEEPRDALVKPGDVADVVIEPDELNRGRVRATLEFSLPRGAYATMLVKRLLAKSWYSQPHDADGDAEADDDSPRARRRDAGERPPSPSPRSLPLRDETRGRLDEDFGSDEE